MDDKPLSPPVVKPELRPTGRALGPPPALPVIRSWAGRYDGQWLVIRVADRRILTGGSLGYCLRWLHDYGLTPAAQAPGWPLSDACQL